MSRKTWTNEKLFYRLANNKTDRTYWDNIRTLRSRPSNETFEQCREYLKSTDAKKRTIGVDVMAQLGTRPRPFYKETIRLLFELLDSETNEKAIWSTLYALSHNNEELGEAEASLLTKFKDHLNSDIRHALVMALLTLDNKVAIDTLIHLSKDSVSATRNWATFGLGTQIDRNNQSIRDALWQRVTDADLDTKLEAILGLAKRRDARVWELIQRELSAGELGSQLFDAIEELNDKSFLPYLEKGLDEVKKGNGINSGWQGVLEDHIEKLRTE